MTPGAGASGRGSLEGAEDALRVLFDARLAVRGLGIATATERLTASLAGIDDIRVDINYSRAGWTRRGKAETIIRSGLLDVRPGLDPRMWRQQVLHCFGNTAPRWPTRTTLITVHDLMSLRNTSLKGRIFASLLAPYLRRHRDGPVVAASRQTADDIIHHFPHLSSCVEVVPHGRRSGRPSQHPRQHVLMFGGRNDPRKRLELGLAAYGAYAERTGSRALPLVIAGRGGMDEQLMNTYAVDKDVRLLADPSGATVDRLLETAACVLYPTSEEGFGLPMIEAGEVGTPIILDGTARIPAEPKGKHVVEVAGADVTAWARGIEQAIEDGPVATAMDHLPTWDQVARTYADLYEEMARR